MTDDSPTARETREIVREAFVEWCERFGADRPAVLDRLRQVKDVHGEIQVEDVRCVAREVRWPVAAASGVDDPPHRQHRTARAGNA